MKHIAAEELLDSNVSPEFQLDVWIEAEKATWSEQVLFCRVRNLSAVPQEFDRVHGAFPFGISIHATDGSVIEERNENSKRRSFKVFAPNLENAMVTGINEMTLLPDASLTIKVPLRRNFLADDFSNAIIRVKWAPKLFRVINTANISLGRTPKVLIRPISVGALTGEWTGPNKEVCLDRVEDKPVVMLVSDSNGRFYLALIAMLVALFWFLIRRKAPKPES
ncbi:MAG: hypothetical protein RLZZ476_2478 [Verrucomicrobiota bacterium]|jgi:hypothetical protein